MAYLNYFKNTQIVKLFENMKNFMNLMKTNYVPLNPQFNHLLNEILFATIGLIIHSGYANII